MLQKHDRHDCGPVNCKTTLTHIHGGREQLGPDELAALVRAGHAEEWGTSALDGGEGGGDGCVHGGGLVGGRILQHRRQLDLLRPLRCSRRRPQLPHLLPTSAAADSDIELNPTTCLRTCLSKDLVCHM